jgi:hypothetical protein
VTTEELANRIELALNADREAAAKQLISLEVEAVAQKAIDLCRIRANLTLSNILTPTNAELLSRRLPADWSQVRTKQLDRLQAALDADR